MPLSLRPGAPRDLARPMPCRSPRRRAGAGLRGAGVPSLPGMRNPCPWLCPGAVRAVRTRLPDRVLVQGARRVPRVQHPAHGGDGSAAPLTDHVLPDLPRRQWVLAVPKRLRYFLERDAELQVLLCASSCARAQPWLAPRGSPRRGRLHPLLRLDAQSAPALPLRRRRRRVRRHRRGGGVFHAAAASSVCGRERPLTGKFP